jgi:hypothetical protein
VDDGRRIPLVEHRNCCVTSDARNSTESVTLTVNLSLLGRSDGYPERFVAGLKSFSHPKLRCAYGEAEASDAMMWRAGPDHGENNETGRSMSYLQSAAHKADYRLVPELARNAYERC